MSLKVRHNCTAFHFRNLDVLPLNDPLRFRACEFKELAVADKIGDAEAGRPCLLGPKEFARAAQLKIEFCDSKPILRAQHCIETLLPLRSDFATGHKYTIGSVGAASNAPTQLMKVRKAEALGMFDDHHRRVLYIDANLDHSSCDEEVDFTALESGHDQLFLIGGETPVQEADAQVRKDFLAELFVHVRG